MVVNQKIIASINEQIGNEFSAMLQYYAMAAHFGAEVLPELSAHFHNQAEEEKKHAAIHRVPYRRRCRPR
jgi:ferritin